MKKLKYNLEKVSPLHVNEFSRHGDILLPGVHVFPDLASANDWFKEFSQRVLTAIEQRKFLPVFRMSHGEFHFALGSKMEVEGSFKTRIAMLKKIIKERLGIGDFLREFSPQAGTHEVLTKKEYLKIRQRVIDDLRWIADQGLVCACFHRTPGYIEYMPDIFDWLDDNLISLNAKNYFHFYFVYGLIFGHKQAELFRNRKIAIITSFPGEKRDRLHQALSTMGVSNLQCIEISSGRALFDRLKPRAVAPDTDLVLVGAGVGATNILRQLDYCKCPVMDVGFAIDALANPELRWRRPFCITDSEWDIHRVLFRPRYDPTKYMVTQSRIHAW